VFYVLVFAVLAVALVVVVLWRSSRARSATDTAPHHHTGTEDASRTASGSAERLERKRRRAQSRHDRRKRH
jgi:FtsZ-interacting cell division protein ZipA